MPTSTQICYIDVLALKPMVLGTLGENMNTCFFAGLTMTLRECEQQVIRRVPFSKAFRKMGRKSGFSIQLAVLFVSRYIATLLFRAQLLTTRVTLLCLEILPIAYL